MNNMRHARIAAACVAALSLMSLAAPAAQAAISGYGVPCRGAVADGRAFLTALGRDPHTNDPKIVMQKLDELAPLIAGQPATQLHRYRAAIHEKCFVWNQD